MDLFTLFLSATLISAILSVYFAYQVYQSGVIAGRYTMSRTTNRHRKCVDMFLCGVVVSVLLVELTVSTKRGVLFEMHLLDTSLGVIHIILDIIFSISVITMRWFITGEDNKELHRKISKVALGSYVLILVTGTWLVIKLIS